MLERGFAGTEMTKDEETTCEAMLGQNMDTRVTVMPTHHIAALVRVPPPAGWAPADPSSSGRSPLLATGLPAD